MARESQAARLDPAVKVGKRPAIHANVLEAHALDANIFYKIKDFQTNSDGPVVPGQHEDEVHAAVPLRTAILVEDISINLASTTVNSKSR